MKIRHYSRKDHPEINSRIQKILTISNQNKILYRDITAINNNPHVKNLNPESIDSIKSKILLGEIEILRHKKWIEAKAPGFWNRVDFVSRYINTWDFESATVNIAHAPLKLSGKRFIPENYIEEKRAKDLERRRQKMQTWYVFFFGDHHL